MSRLRLLERVGRALGFSPEGRPVSLWVEGWPGEEHSRIVPGTLTRRVDGAAVVRLDEPAELGGRAVRFVLARPRERGFGLDALWFSFIAVDAQAIDRPEEPAAAGELGRFAMRLRRG